MNLADEDVNMGPFDRATRAEARILEAEDPQEVVGITDDDQPAPAPPPLTHDEIVQACEDRLVAEGQPPFTAKLLANVYADSFELRKLLDGLAAMGGVDGVIGGVFGKLLGGRKRKGGADD